MNKSRLLTIKALQAHPHCSLHVRYCA